MHFTVMYLLKGEELENTSIYEITEDFFDRYCYGLGEARPRYQWLCDWFQVGGRWCDLFVASNGIKGERSFFNVDEEDQKDCYSIVEVKDLTEPISEDMIYAVATKSKVYYDSDQKYHKLIESINNKTFKGVIALIDCHD